MKPGSKAWKKFMNKIRSYSRIIYAITICSVALKMDISSYMIIISGSTVALMNFMAAFEPIHEEPNWEYVYPELALGYSEELDVKE